MTPMTETFGPIEANDLLTGCALMATIVARYMQKGTRANPDPPDFHQGANLDGRHDHPNTCMRGVEMAGRSIGQNPAARQSVSFEFSTTPGALFRRRCDSGGRFMNPPRRSRWIRCLLACFFGLFLCASLAGNAWQARRWLRDQALLWLKPDQPIARIAADGQSHLGREFARLREEIAEHRRLDQNEVKALRETFNLAEESKGRIRYELEQLQDQFRMSENSRQNFQQGVKEIRGELIRRNVIPKEYSTAF